MSSVDKIRRVYKGVDDIPIVADIGGDQSRPTLILSHGGGQTRHSWSGAMTALLDAGYRVINFDTRGHGESGWDAAGRYNVSRRSQDMVPIIRDANGPVALVGASMGGNTALYTALTADVNVGALILVDIVPKPEAAGVQRIKDFMARHLNGFSNLDEAVDAVAAYNPTRTKPTDSKGLLKNLRQRGDRLYWHWDPAITEIRSEDEYKCLADAISQNHRAFASPILIVRGGQSDVVSRNGTNALRAYFPQTEILEVAGAGHMIAGDRNDEFNIGILQFLVKHFSTKPVCSG
jgi:pimeloyl-ACP methyl ester carboxylesterase